MNQSIYYKTVCTTAPATPGVLNTTAHSLQPSRSGYCKDILESINPKFAPSPLNTRSDNVFSPYLKLALGRWLLQ